MQADRYNNNKPKWSLIDFKSLEPLVRVLEYGCIKYEKNNWKKGLPASETMESMVRHCFKLMGGELTDSESGISHIGHIMANAMFLAYNMREKKEQFDNRFKGHGKPEESREADRSVE